MAFAERAALDAGPPMPGLTLFTARAHVHPQAAALDLYFRACERTIVGEMLCLSWEKPTPGRHFAVAPLASFLAWAQSAAAQSYLSFHEVVPADTPCHFFMDLDAKGAVAARLAAVAPGVVYTLIYQLIGMAAAQLGLMAESIVFGDASGLVGAAGEPKFSVHVHARMYRLEISASAWFASAADVGVFVARMEAIARSAHTQFDLLFGDGDAFLADMGPYRRNGSLRMIGCGKWVQVEAPDGPMWMLTRALEARGTDGQPVGRQQGLLASLITVPRWRGQEPDLVLVRLVKPRIEAMAPMRDVAGGVEGATVAWLEETLALRATAARMLGCKMVVSLDSHECPFEMRAHKSNFVYAVVDMDSGQADKRCRDPQCGGRRAHVGMVPFIDEHRDQK